MGKVSALICSGLVAAITALATPVLAGDDQITGVWMGTMRQIYTDGEDKYPMTLNILGMTGDTDYPTYKCSGLLRRLDIHDGQTIYAETITRGRYGPDNKDGCVDGFIVVKRGGETLGLAWAGVFNGNPITATAVLSKGLSTSQ